MAERENIFDGTFHLSSTQEEAAYSISLTARYLSCYQLGVAEYVLVLEAVTYTHN